MSIHSSYEEKAQLAASAAIAKGHADPSNLRELLIWTTSKTTVAMVDIYFCQHHDDKNLLTALFEIALEGEDAGDAPWAAANTIADFPAPMLVEHRAALVQLSQFEWNYLRVPALKALAKLDEFDT